MALTIVAEEVPLREDANGTIRLGKTRVSLEVVIAVFRMGSTAEEIVWQFPTLDLADVYAVLSYYLRHQAEVDAYIQESEQEAQRLRAEVEARQGSQQGLRERLLARRAVPK